VPPGVCSPQLRGHTPSNRGAPDRHTDPSSRDVASPPVPRRPRGRGSDPAPWQGSGNNRRPPPPPPMLAPEGFSRSVHGLDRAQPTPAWRCARRALVSRGPHTPATPRDARRLNPSPRAHTHTPVSLPHHVRLPDSSPPPRDVTHPRWLRRCVRWLVPPPTPRRAVHPAPPVVPVVSCFCRPSPPAPPSSW